MNETRRERRVGPFTMGLALIFSGLALCLWQIFPRGSIWDLLRFSPALLVMLGVEVLLSSAANKHGTLKYDWLGMFLCCLIICACLCASALGTYMVNLG